VLRRLLAEAEAQGAAPTDDDLARALGISRRTVLRDMEALREAGVTFPTRRRSPSRES
jgi:biotin operon repressor